MRNFSDLDEQEVLALAISLEEDDERTYDNYAHFLEENYPDSAAVFREMADEEAGHRRRLVELYKQRFGDFIPLIRRNEVRGFMRNRYMDTPFLNAAFQVVVGGVLVFLTGFFIGGAG